VALLPDQADPVRFRCALQVQDLFVLVFFVFIFFVFDELVVKLFIFIDVVDIVVIQIIVRVNVQVVVVFVIVISVFEAGQQYVYLLSPVLGLVIEETQLGNGSHDMCSCDFFF